MALPDDLLQPIAGANPGGANLRYDPVYDKLKEARREEEDVDQGDWKRARKVADWPLVTKLASDVLAKQSKDLQVAAWLTESLVRQQGLGGLRTGLGVVRGLLDRFWDNLHPALEDGDVELRAAPLTWVGRYLDVAVRTVPLTKTGHNIFKYKESRAVPTEAEVAKDDKKQAARKAALAEGKLSPEEFGKAFDATPKAWYKQLRADLDGCLTGVQGLDELGQQKFGDAAPSYSKLREALEDVRHVSDQLLDQKLQAEPDPPDAAALESASSGAGGGGGGSGAVAGALTPEPTSADDAATRIAGAARYLRHADPRNPAPYLMVRGFRWGELRARGPELNPKLLSAPPTAVRTQLVGLLRDVPQLPDLTLMDDTPTANAETRAWLQKGGLLAAAAQSAQDKRAVAAASPAPAETRPRYGGAVYERAMEEVRAGRPQKGIELLMREADQEKSPRTKFLRRSEAAAIMVESGLEPVALPILIELVQQIGTHKLEEWESPDIVARPMALLYRTLHKVGGDTGTKDDLYRRVCRLDPMQAIAFPTGSAGPNGPAGA